MRRLPVYVLLDTSGSMRGEPIESLRSGMSMLLSTLRRDPHSLESVHLCIISFDKEVKVLLPLTPIGDLSDLPEIVAPDSGPTHMGKALRCLYNQINEDNKGRESKQKDWRPNLFIMTDGGPSDLQEFKQMTQKIKRVNFAVRIGLEAGPKAKKGFLKEVVGGEENVHSLEEMSSGKLEAFFQWVSNSINVSHKSLSSTSDVILPPPPPEEDPVAF